MRPGENPAPIEPGGNLNVARVGEGAQVDQLAVGTHIQQVKYVGYSVEQVQVLLEQIRTTYRPKPFDGRSPYVGLTAFQEQDADRFFGREKLVQELVARVASTRFLVLAGPSGSGKSSLARAGLIPALKRGALPGSEHWLNEILSPGRRPLAELGRVVDNLRDLKAGDDLRQEGRADPTRLSRWLEAALGDQRTRRAVLLVDQFEEAFTQVVDETERAAFFNLLLSAATAPDGRVTVICVTRSDFIGNWALYPNLNARLSEGVHQIPPMQADELVSAIARPALQAGLPIEPDLIKQILDDMDQAPGALPLMQFALQDLFEYARAKGGVIALTRDGYLERGGLRRALARHADAEFAKLSPDKQQIAKTVFASLIEPGRGTSDTKRTAFIEELIPAGTDAARVHSLVVELADARLITTDEQEGRETITLAHEKLIDAWDWLHRLVNENREAIARQNEINADALEWDRNRRDPSYLYTGARLAAAREGVEGGQIVLNELAQTFITAGIQAERNELEEAWQRAARLRRQALYLAGTLALAVLLGAAALLFGMQSNQTASANATLASQNAAIALTAQAASTRAVAEAATRTAAEAEAVAGRNEAQRQAQLALSRQLASQALDAVDRQLDLSLLLSVEALHTDRTVEARSSLLTALLRSPRLQTYLHSDLEGATPLAFDPSGTLLASTGVGNTILLWDFADPASPKRVGVPLQWHRDFVTSLSFSADGKRLASAGNDNAVVVWDLTNSAQPIAHRISADSGGAGRAYAVFDPKRAEVLATFTNSRDVAFWNVSALDQPVLLSELPRAYSSTGGDLVFRPDGGMLAVIDNHTVDLWDVSDLSTPRLAGQVTIAGNFAVLSTTFNRTGNRLALGDSSAQVSVYDITDPAEPRPQYTFDPGYATAFNPMTDTLAVSGTSIDLYDLSVPGSRTELQDPLRGNNEIAYRLAFSPDGKWLASARQGDVVVWDATPQPRWPIQLSVTPLERTPVLAYSPDYRWLAAGDSAELRLWDMSDLRKPVSMASEETAGFGETQEMAVSPDGRLLATTYENGTVLWDVSKPRSPTVLFATGESFRDLVFNPRAPELVAGGRDALELWDISDPLRPITSAVTLVDQIGVLSLDFRPDGQVLAVGGRDGTIALLDMTRPFAPTLAGGPVAAYPAYVQDLAFSPDGRTLATALGDPFAGNGILLWDVSTVSTPRKLGEPLEGVFYVEFGPDGKTLATGSQLLWDISQPTLPTSLGLPLARQARLVFGREGASLVTVDTDGRLVTWDLDERTWETVACRMANRNLTPTEWQRYLGSVPYRATCQP